MYITEQSISMIAFSDHLHRNAFWVFNCRDVEILSVFFQLHGKDNDINHKEYFLKDSFERDSYLVTSGSPIQATPFVSELLELWFTLGWKLFEFMLVCIFTRVKNDANPNLFFHIVNVDANDSMCLRSIPLVSYLNQTLCGPIKIQWLADVGHFLHQLQREILSVK